MKEVILEKIKGAGFDISQFRVASTTFNPRGENIVITNDNFNAGEKYGIVQIEISMITTCIVVYWHYADHMKCGYTIKNEEVLSAASFSDLLIEAIKHMSERYYIKPGSRNVKIKPREDCYL